MGVKTTETERGNPKEVLRELRNKINVNKLGIKILHTAETKDNQLILKYLLRKKGADENFAKEIRDCLGVKGDVREVKEITTDIIVKDLDEDNTVEEIKNAIMATKVIGEDERGVIVIKPPRETVDSQRRGGKKIKSAIVTVPIAVGRKLLEQTKRINVGWNRCRIESRIVLSRCYRCQVFGHRANQCKEEVKGKCCVRCGQKEHEARNCKGALRCYVCREDGHRADSMSCPVYRRSVQKEREDRRVRVGNEEWVAWDSEEENEAVVMEKTVKQNKGPTD